jgi:hypothetical protein
MVARRGWCSTRFADRDFGRETQRAEDGLALSLTQSATNAGVQRREAADLPKAPRLLGEARVAAPTPDLIAPHRAAATFRKAPTAIRSASQALGAAKLAARVDGLKFDIMRQCETTLPPGSFTMRRRSAEITEVVQ